MPYAMIVGSAARWRPRTGEGAPMSRRDASKHGGGPRFALWAVLAVVAGVVLYIVLAEVTMRKIIDVSIWALRQVGFL